MWQAEGAQENNAEPRSVQVDPIQVEPVQVDPMEVRPGTRKPRKAGRNGPWRAPLVAARHRGERCA